MPVRSFVSFHSLRYYIVFVFIKFFQVDAQDTPFYNPFIDVQHYAFAIELNDFNNQIGGNAFVTIRFLQKVNTIAFDLIAINEKKKGMIVLAVDENERSTTFEQSPDFLKVQLNTPADVGETRIYRISYEGEPFDGLVFSKNKFGQRTIFSDNWPNRARNWLPCVDHLSDKASVEFMITAPAHYKVISNGILIEESLVGQGKKFTHWKESVTLPTKVMAIGLADFAVNYPGDVNGIPVSSWVFFPDSIKGFYDYQQAMEILPFFIKNIGPYAYKKLANVEAITIFGGMENASAIFYNERSITGKKTAEALIAHEISHQWFGNSATESGWPHLWLSEGFATEMANLYLESKYGSDTVESRLKADRKAIIGFAKIRFTPVVDSSEKENFLALININSYKKGGWILHMLRRRLGDSIFWKGIQTYYQRYAGKNVSTGDLQKVFEDVSGTDMKDFFKQWLFTAGHPVIHVGWRYNAVNKAVELTITQEQPHLFSFPLEFSFENNGMINRQTFMIKDKVSIVKTGMLAKPETIKLDPATNLLFEGSVAEKE